MALQNSTNKVTRRSVRKSSQLDSSSHCGGSALAMPQSGTLIGRERSWQPRDQPPRQEPPSDRSQSHGWEAG